MSTVPPLNRLGVSVEFVRSQEERLRDHEVHGRPGGCLDEVGIGVLEFQRQPLESNRILIGGRPLEDWLGATAGKNPCCHVCGPNECRTLTVDGRTHEVIPAEVVIRAGLLAAAALTTSRSE